MQVIQLLVPGFSLSAPESVLALVVDGELDLRSPLLLESLPILLREEKRLLSVSLHLLAPRLGVMIALLVAILGDDDVAAHGVWHELWEHTGTLGAEIV